MKTRTNKRCGKVRFLALVLAVGCTAAACGSSDGAAGQTENGLPTLSSGDDAADASGQNENGSSDVANDGGGTVDEAELTVSQEDAVMSYLTCLEEEGVDMAMMQDPSASTEEMDAFMSEPTFAAADAKCSELLGDAFGSFELDPEFEASLAERSADVAACASEILGIDVPDDFLLLGEDDPRAAEILGVETTAEEEALLTACVEDNLADLVDDEGNFTGSEGGE